MTLTPVVTFSFADFIGLFPEFGALSPTLASAYFTRATNTIFANDTTNPCFPDGHMPYLVYLATAHVAWLYCQKDMTGMPTSDPSSAQASSPLVGRVSQASEGSVSVSTEYPLDGSSSAQEKYLAQTKYGIELWAALAPYRTAQYAARPTYVFGGRFRAPIPLRSGGRFWW
jgi:Protein of unknown function (DUF4054)